MTFINKMLFFRSLDDNLYIGYEQSSKDILNDILEKGHLQEFEEFLNEAGIVCRLKETDFGGKPPSIGFEFDGEIIDFWKTASRGTRSLALFYFWYQRIRDGDASLIFIDEFDAFYHHSLSKLIVKKMKEIEKSQVIITTHNTSVMTNDLLRPDCYFLLKNNVIKSLSQKTDEELCFEYNIEKMYKSGFFE